MNSLSIQEPFLIKQNLDAVSPLELGEASLLMKPMHSRIYELAISELAQSLPFNSSIIHTKKAISLKAILGIGGMLGRIPLIQVSKDFEKVIPAIGSIFAATNFVSYSSYLIWASSSMVNQILNSFAVNIEDRKTCSSTIKKTSLLAFNIINGCVAQIPYFILSWDYNKSKPYMVGLNAMDVTLPIYSLQLMTQQKLFSIGQSNLEKNLGLIQKDLIRRFDLILNLHTEKDLSSALSIFSQIDHDSGQRKFDKLLNLMFSDEYSEVKNTLSRSDKAIHLSALTLGSILMGIQLAWFALLCSQGITKLTDNKALLGAACAYVMICNFALTQFVLVASSHQTINGALKLCMKNKITYLSERLCPLASRVAKVASIAISITAFIPAAQMSLDYLPSVLVVPSSIGYGLGFVFMDYLPMRELLEDLMHLGLGYLGNDFQKEHIKIHQKLISVKSLIENADKKAVAKLLVKLYSNPHIQTALRKHQVNMQELASYIDLEKIDIDEAV